MNTVLVVDDTPSKRYILASWLRRGGYAVDEAATGAQALERFERGGVDLVVLDVRLPDASGFEVCEQMKAHPVHGATPVIHVSAAAIHAVDRTHGLERGADAYLVEPIDPDELLATVSAILRYYQARIQAERLASRLANLVRVTAAMNGVTAQRALLEAAAAGGAEIFQAPILVIANDADGARVVAACTGPGAAVDVRPSMVDVGDEPVGVRFADESAGRWPQIAFPPDGTVRVLTVRTRADRPALYVIVPTAATLEGAPVLTLFGQAVMAATEAVRLFDEEHNLALTLQRSLLPARPPAVAGYDLAIRYVPASDTAEIGGDFYEVVRIGDRLFIAVGDVGGHSLHAATVMAELRHATRAYLVEGHGPAAVLDRLNTLVRRLLPGEIATLCLFSLDTATGEMLMANAGHPPPLLHRPDPEASPALPCAPGSVSMISEHGPLLGIHVRAATETKVTLDPGATLVLYTDGLVELRTETFDESFERLAAASVRIERDLEEYASRLLADVGPPVPSDDIALVVLRRQPAG
ncbi:fused response regulator/phosphatase [Hamadaea tsunoensis]|uniref:fused response regulator/phosphatase n=1 Tax=Hamadaea tsunoensis TaxID=53368 RepID=UPI00048129DE|nr:fused response regulator/phosphatase [Hamadaea tsunoensis]